MISTHVTILPEVMLMYSMVWRLASCGGIECVELSHPIRVEPSGHLSDTQRPSTIIDQHSVALHWLLVRPMPRLVAKNAHTILQVCAIDYIAQQSMFTRIVQYCRGTRNIDLETAHAQPDRN